MNVKRINPETKEKETFLVVDTQMNPERFNSIKRGAETAIHQKDREQTILVEDKGRQRGVQVITLDIAE